nr:hypothetical protein [Tanacetum cinerariifolium]
MGDENLIRSLGDDSKLSHEGYRNTIKLPVGNIVSEDPNQHLKDFLKLVESLDLDDDNRERTRLRRTAKLCNNILMFQQHHGESLSETWTRFKDLLKKSLIMASSAAIERLAQYENEGWNDGFITDEASLNYKNFDIEQLLGIMERKFNTLMKDAISSIGESESPMSKRPKSTKGQASSSRKETMEEKVRKFKLFNNGNHQMNYNNLAGCSIHAEDVVDWEFLSNKGLAQPFFNFINTVTFFGPQWVNLYQINEPIFCELVREFFASFKFDASPCRESSHVATLSGLRNAEMVNATRLIHLFWPSIGDGMFNVGNTEEQSIRNPRIKLAHRCITMTITGRKETTNHVTEIDLFYLHCIFREGVVCNIPYWLAKYLKSIRDKSFIFRGMFVTRIAQSFGLLTNEMVSVLNREPLPHVYRKTSLVKMGVIMEIYKGKSCWPATRWIIEESKGDDEEGNREWGKEGVGGSTDIYCKISQCDWQVRQARWMDQQDERWGRIDA